MFTGRTATCVKLLQILIKSLLQVGHSWSYVVSSCAEAHSLIDWHGLGHRHKRSWGKRRRYLNVCLFFCFHSVDKPALPALVSYLLNIYYKKSNKNYLYVPLHHFTSYSISAGLYFREAPHFLYVSASLMTSTPALVCVIPPFTKVTTSSITDELAPSSAQKKEHV